MKKILINIVLILLMTFNGLVSGAFIGSLFVPKASGLAGGVMVFWYALFGGLIFGIATSITLKKVEGGGSRIWFLMASTLAIIFVFVVIYKLKNEDNGVHDTNNNPVTAPVIQSKLVDYQQRKTEILGLGMAFVKFPRALKLYFYNTGQLDVDPYPDAIVDSVTFGVSQNQMNIQTAPPWLFPEYIKMDYDIFLFKVVAVSRHRAQVIVNKQTNEKRWVSKEDVLLKYWPEFILDVNSIEAINVETNPVRLKPLDQASILSSQGNTPLRPLAINADWVLVSTNGLADRIQPAGWIRWKKKGALLIRYSLLE